MQNVRAARWVLAGFFGILLIACDDPEHEHDGGTAHDGGASDAGRDGGRPAEGCQGPPGLYADDECEILAVGVRAYTPRFPLWSDGAAKERFIYLPPGSTIDTSDPDDWVFPVGTRIYKNFYQDGVRLETRVLEKHQLGTGPSAWYMRTYKWNESQDGVTDVTNADVGVRTNVLGTDHDIPSGSQCIECHSGTLDTVNSFSAIQLNHEDAGFTLEMLGSERWLTDPIAPEDAEIPGTATESEALGYLHANCGNCHRTTPMAGNPDACRTPACSIGLHFWIDVGQATVDATSTYQTAVAVRHTYWHAELPEAARCRVHPGEPDLSLVHFRMEARGDTAQMPPIGTEKPDLQGLETVRAWIAGLAVDASACEP